MSDVPENLDRLNELLGAIPLECEGMTIGELLGRGRYCVRRRGIAGLRCE